MSWKDMCKLCGRKIMSPRCNNAECDTDEIEEGACFNRDLEFIPPIFDCIQHYEDCLIRAHHEDCKCQNP